MNDKNAKAINSLHFGSFFFSPHVFMNNFTSYFVLASKKICCRCGKIYGVTPTGRHSRVEECYYHFGRVLTHKGKCLVVLFRLFDKPVPELFREKYNIQFTVFVKCSTIKRNCTESEV